MVKTCFSIIFGLKMYEKCIVDLCSVVFTYIVSLWREKTELATPYNLFFI